MTRFNLESNIATFAFNLITTGLTFLTFNKTYIFHIILYLLINIIIKSMTRFNLESKITTFAFNLITT